MSEFMKLQRKQIGSHSSIFSTPDSSPTTPHVSPAPTIAHNFSQVSVLPKLEVSQPHDPAEQEADRVADQIMRMPEPINTGQMVMRSLHETIHRKCAACGEEEDLMRKASEAGEMGEGAIEQVHRAVRSGGQPLDEATRNFMEPRFGHDFGQVRIHADSQASDSARGINARAYTLGQNVVFGSGQYAPGANAGKELLAHELTHVVQQTGGVPTAQRRPISPIFHNALPLTDKPHQVMREGTEDTAVDVTQSDANSSQTTDTTTKLLALITRLEQLHSQSDHQLGSQGQSNAPDQNDALQQEGQKHLGTLSAGLEQLRAVARSNDEALKQRVMLAFTPSALQAAEREATSQVKAVAVPSQLSAAPEATPNSTTINQQTPVDVAAKPMIVSSPQDAAELEADRVAEAVVSGESVAIHQQTSDNGIHRAAAAALIAFGTAALAADAEAAPAEAAVGPVGWAIGLGIAAVAIASIGVGYAISSDTDSPPVTNPAPAPAPGTSAPPVPVPVPSTDAPPIPIPVPQTRRWPKQTCENDVLDTLQEEMHKICDSIPGGSCSPSKVSPKKLAKRPCSEIRARILAFQACLAARQRVQDECFGGVPDPRHDGVFDQVNNGLAACLALEAINCAPGHPMADL